MKTKLEMAHEIAVAMQSKEPITDMKLLSALAWQYADAMQAEADKREKEEAAQRRKEIREMLNAPNTFVEREGQHFDDVADACKTYGSSGEWQPDWSQAPSGYDWFVVGGRSGKGFFCLIEPAIVKDHYWFVGEDCLSVDKHNYQGDWRNSLRKRPK